MKNQPDMQDLSCVLYSNRSSVVVDLFGRDVTQPTDVERRTGLRLKPSAVLNKIQQMLYFVDTLQAFASFCNIFMLFILLPYSFCSRFNHWV